ncbi:hypothetical protein AB0L71_21970 [Streptomyces sp. NPDC052052]|uniref:hypothetical protein n=1 Tax=Streptomyces sp. NPDC052052 TaxID=3154756 RepID=UPI0034156E74
MIRPLGDRVIESADRVGRFLFAVTRNRAPDLGIRFLGGNGAPGLLVLAGTKPGTVFPVDG